MRASTWIKSFAAIGLVLALTGQAVAALADGSENNNQSGNQALAPGSDWNDGQPLPHVFDARPLNSYGAVGSTAGLAPITFHGGVTPLGGGTNVGVTTGKPQIYLVFYGSQWGTKTTSNGLDSFTGDPKGMAPYLERFIAGLGTAGDNWSGVATEYCDQLAVGATTCGVNDTTNRAGYPTGGMLAGTWYDNGVASPSTATQSQLASEAVAAAKHFGNTTQTSNRSIQYVIVSPTGTHPASFNTPSGGFCAWHSTAVNGTTAYLAYTNLPYITDMGTSCGQNYVNAGAAGTLDGVSIVEGHELAEIVTDQWPNGGYLDSSNYENGDKCSWTNTADSRNGGNITTTTGTFAMQGTWSNLNAWCSMGSALAGTTAITTIPGVTITTRVATGGVFPYSVTTNSALPNGMFIANDGRIIGVASATGSYNYSYTVTDALGTVTQANGTLTVQTPTPTSLALAASATNVSTTTTVTLTATSTPAVSGASVTFYDGATAIGTAVTSSTGVATLKKTFTAGSHSISAVMAPSGLYSGSTSGTVTVTAVIATTLSLKASATSTTKGTAVTLTGTLSAKVAGLTISFSGGTGQPTVTALTNSTGVATVTYSWPTSGTYKATASFAGTATYGASTSSSVSITVQ
jgi:Bacterial Ig-like domain (group 3)